MLNEKEQRLIVAFRNMDDESKDAFEMFLRWLLSDPEVYLAYHQRAIEMKTKVVLPDH